MSPSFIVQFSFQYVPLTLLSTVYLLFYQMRMVSKYRKRAGVKYPQCTSFKFKLKRPLFTATPVCCSICREGGTREFLGSDAVQLRSAYVSLEVSLGLIFDPFVSKVLIKTHWRTFRFCTPRTLF